MMCLRVGIVGLLTSPVKVSRRCVRIGRVSSGTGRPTLLREHRGCGRDGARPPAVGSGTTHKMQGDAIRCLLGGRPPIDVKDWVSRLSRALFKDGRVG